MLPFCKKKKKSLPGERKKKKPHISCFVLSLFEQIFMRSLLCVALSWCAGCGGGLAAKSSSAHNDLQESPALCPHRAYIRWQGAPGRLWEGSQEINKQSYKHRKQFPVVTSATKTIKAGQRAWGQEAAPDKAVVEFRTWQQVCWVVEGRSARGGLGWGWWLMEGKP